jgi:alpha-tubulin suppressor-like RCC1 family protein
VSGGVTSRTSSTLKRVLLAVTVLASAAACTEPLKPAHGDDDEEPSPQQETTNKADPREAGSSAAPLPAPAPVRIGAGLDFSCAITSAGAVKCWGRNDRGQLGLGDTFTRGVGPFQMGSLLPVVDLGQDRRAISLAVGWYHACALLDDATVKCWGQNDAGQLGQGDTQNRGVNAGQMGKALAPIALANGGRKVVSVAAGGYHNCALFDDGGVQCWGANAQGQLGLGDRNHRGDTAGELGDALPRTELGKGRRAVAIAAGNFHTCAILDDGALKCWGSGADGQLGLGNKADRGDAAGEMGDALPAVALEGKAVAVAAGGFHTCAVVTGGHLKCWGHNDGAQQGNGDTTKRGDDPGEMGSALPTVHVGAGRTVKAVTALYDHSCALLDDDSVKCWGRNEGGQLGLGDTATRGATPASMGDALPAVQLGTGRKAMQISAGWDHTCALLDDGAFKCWGLNLLGALGQGDIFGRGDLPNEMGDRLGSIKL